MSNRGDEQEWGGEGRGEERRGGWWWNYRGYTAHEIKFLQHGNLVMRGSLRLWRIEMDKCFACFHFFSLLVKNSCQSWGFMPPILRTEVIITQNSPFAARSVRKVGGLGMRSWGLAALMGKKRGVGGYGCRGGRGGGAWHTHAGSAKEAPQSRSVYGRLWGWGFSGVVVDTKGSWPLNYPSDKCCVD